VVFTDSDGAEAEDSSEAVGYNGCVRDSGVRQFRRPPRVQPNRRDAELAALVANIPGAIYRCALDRNYTMAMISDEIERISGYPASDFILNRARSFVSVIHPDDRADVEREIADATSEDRPFALEYRIVRADGSVAWVLERGQLVVDADDQVSLHGVVFDISERKRAEDVLRRREAEEARIAELEAARARIIAAQDETRRQIERDLHDGAQQRLVTLALILRMVKTKLAGNPEAAAGLLDQALDAVAEATAELRELARGIHPALLTDRGLPAAVDVLAERAPLPVTVQCALSERLPAPVEAAGYYLVAEALTNVARHAEATTATVCLARRSGCAVVSVEDDGIGGASSDAGSGLRGLLDRIDALGGSFSVRSEPGKGTRIEAEIPLTFEPPS
jgi:PAS domain S-box-containing protein